MNLLKLRAAISAADSFKRYGRVKRVVGMLIESEGPFCSIGDLCLIHSKDGQRTMMAEVTGFKDERILLTPYTDMNEIAPGSFVESLEHPLRIKVGPSLIGKIIDPMGQPFDGALLPHSLASVDIEAEPPNPLTRPPIEEALEVGVKAIDGMLTIGKGQRVGIFAGSGVGKSTLLGMIARNTNADLNVIALIGERGREVREFIERDLGPEGMKKTIVVAATSDQPALMRIKGALTATAIAEFFRDRGLNVMLMMDSVTRVAMAQREVGLAAGEPPATKGYTPSVFALLPKLLERTGTSENGTITAFYTVLVDGDDLNEPIADAVRGILDGHIVLDRKLANKGQYPAINVLKSISRLMPHIAQTPHYEAAIQVRDLLNTYLEAEDLINIGAYKKGSSAHIDQAIDHYEAILSFLKQRTSEKISLQETVFQLISLIAKGAK